MDIKHCVGGRGGGVGRGEGYRVGAAEGAKEDIHVLRREDVGDP